MKYGITNLDPACNVFDLNNISKYKNGLDSIEEIFKVEDKLTLDKEQLAFLTDSQRATTDAAVRVRRSNYILKIIHG